MDWDGSPGPSDCSHYRMVLPRQSHHHGRSQSHCCLCVLHPWGTCRCPFDPSFGLGYPWNTDSSMNVRRGHKDVVDQPYSWKFWAFGPCAPKGILQTHRESVPLKVEVIEQRGKVCLLPGHPVSGLGKNRDLSQRRPDGPTPAVRRGGVRSTSSSTGAGI